MVFFIYSFLSVLVYPVLRLFLLLRIKRGKEDKLRYTEKLGIYSRKRPEGNLTWFHAASVGELNSISSIIKVSSETNILVTTCTVTSYEVFKNKLSGIAIHQFVPLDSIICVKRFLNYWQPNTAVFVDSELWPCLLSQIKQRKISAYLLNGRFSYKSQQRWLRHKSVFQALMSTFNTIFPFSNDTKTFLESCNIRNLGQVGNIKYDAYKATFNQERVSELRNVLSGYKTIVCVSTHNGEEEILCQIYKKIKHSINNLKLIILPRHIARSENILTTVQAENITCSIGEVQEADIWIINKFGVVSDFYEIADVVFVGGSLVDIGGHNPIEPAYHKKAILIGDYYSNFTEIINNMMADKAINIISKSNFEIIKTLLLNQSIANSFGVAAYNHATQHSGISQHIIKILKSETQKK